MSEFLFDSQHLGCLDDTTMSSRIVLASGKRGNWDPLALCQFNPGGANGLHSSQLRPATAVKAQLTLI